MLINSHPPLTPARARVALIALVRRHSDAFIGRPDADRLARLPLKDLGDGRRSLGAFIIDVRHRTYEAIAGRNAPETYVYTGAFRFTRGAWTASLPRVVRAHQR